MQQEVVQVRVPSAGGIPHFRCDYIDQTHRNKSKAAGDVLAETSDEDENGNHRPACPSTLAAQAYLSPFASEAKPAKSLTAPAYVHSGAVLLAEDGSHNGVA